MFSHLHPQYPSRFYKKNTKQIFFESNWIKNNAKEQNSNTQNASITWSRWSKNPLKSLKINIRPLTCTLLLISISLFIDVRCSSYFRQRYWVCCYNWSFFKALYNFLLRKKVSLNNTKRPLCPQRWPQNPNDFISPSLTSHNHNTILLNVCKCYHGG